MLLQSPNHLFQLAIFLIYFNFIHIRIQFFCYRFYLVQIRKALLRLEINLFRMCIQGRPFGCTTRASTGSALLEGLQQRKILKIRSDVLVGEGGSGLCHLSCPSGKYFAITSKISYC